MALCSATKFRQTGFGMYVKYLMVGLLVVFAVSMTVQFSAYFLRSAARLRGEPEREPSPRPRAASMTTGE